MAWKKIYGRPVAMIDCIEGGHSLDGSLAGIDHVSIGSDFDGFTDPPEDLKDASELPKLTQRLLAEGYRPEDIAKIWGGNALWVLREGWCR